MSPLMERALLLLLRTATILLAVAGVYFFVRYFWPLVSGMIATGIKIILPFVVAYIVAAVLNPVVVYLERRLRLPRTPGTLLTLAVFLIILGGAIYLLFSNLIQELLDLSQNLDTLSQDLSSWRFNLLLEQLQLLLARLNLPADFIRETGEDLLEILKNFVTVFSRQIFYLVTALPQYFILLVVTVIASFFFTRDYEMIKANFFKFVPDHWQGGIRRVGKGLHKALFGYLKAELLLISITGLQSAIGLTLLGVRYALLVVLLVAILDLLPVVGPGAIFIPWGLWMIFTGSVRFGIGLLILYGIIVIVRQILEPKVLGESIGLYPLTTLMALYFGISLLGFWGLILGPAAVIAYKAFVDKD